MAKCSWIQQQLFGEGDIPMRKKSKLTTNPVKVIRRAYDAEGNLRVVNCECDDEFTIVGSREYPVKGKHSTKCPKCGLFPWLRQPEKRKSGNGKASYAVAISEDGVDQI
jgi:hypothetical protein